MTEETTQGNLENTPVLQMLKQIHDKTLDPKSLSKDMRQDCVEYLWHTEFQSVSGIAQILGVSDKTIRRDEEEIRQRKAKEPSTDYSVTVFGELLAKATSVHEHMMRLVRTPDASLSEKANATYYAGKLIQQQIQIAQSLGVAPSQALKIEASVRQEAEKTPQQLKEELSRLEKIATDSGSINDPEVIRLIEEVRRNIALAEAKEGLVRLESRITELNKPKETTGGQ